MKNKIWLISLLLVGVFMASLVTVDAGTIEFNVWSTGENYIVDYVPEEVTTFNFMNEPFQLIISEENDEITFVNIYDETSLMEGETIGLTEDFPGANLNDLMGTKFLYHFYPTSAVIGIGNIDLENNLVDFFVYYWSQGGVLYTNQHTGLDYIPEEITTFDFMDSSFQLIISEENNEITFVDIYEEEELIHNYDVYEGDAMKIYPIESWFTYHGDIDFLYHFGDVAEVIEIEDVNPGGESIPIPSTTVSGGSSTIAHGSTAQGNSASSYGIISYVMKVGETTGGITLEDIGSKTCDVKYKNKFYELRDDESVKMVDGIYLTVRGIKDLTIRGIKVNDIESFCEISITDKPLEMYLDTPLDDLSELGQEVVKIERVSDKLSEIKQNGFSVQTTSQIVIEGNKLFLEEQEIKIMPKKLNEKFKNIERVDLKLIEEKPVYVVEHKEDYKLFGFIPIKPTVITQVSAEDEEILKTEKSDWLFLAKKQ